MLIYTYILSAFFLFWFIATVAFQFRDSKASDWVRSIDFFSLIPLWTFFAPNPGTNDYHLLYRDESFDGERSEWSEIEINENRKLLTCIWNPNKRGKKVLCDVIQNIVPMINVYKDNPKTIMLSLPYILILNAVLTQKNIFDNTKSKQFLLTASHGYNSNLDPKLILISEFHSK